MATSAARIAANRQNAQRSSGPRTAEGKASSKRNALKHGLTALVVDLGDNGDGEPETEMSREWLRRQVERTIRRIDRGERIEDRLRLEAVWRASATWDEDRTLAAENIARHLQREPARTVARLRQTPQGCDWLIGHWEALARVAEGADDAWTDEQTQLAHDLLGTLVVARDDSALLVGDQATPERAALARCMIAELDECRVTAAEADEIAQVQAAADLVDLPTPDLARLRRYDTALHRRLHWLMAALQTAPVEAVSPARPAEALAPVVASEASAPAPPPDGAPRNEPKRDRATDETNPTEPAHPLDSAPQVAPEPTWSTLNLAPLVLDAAPTRRPGGDQRRSA